MHESIKEQEKAAKAGLEYLQVQANKDALEAECKGQSDEIAVAQAHFVESMCIMSRVPSGVVVSWHLTQPLLDAVHQRFAEVKEDSREKLRISREKLEECDDEIRGQFQQMEEVSRRRCRARAVPVPLTHTHTHTHAHTRLRRQAGDITRKSTAEWEAELATGHEELNMNMATNANVVEQYNKRKAEVRPTTYLRLLISFVGPTLTAMQTDRNALRDHRRAREAGPQDRAGHQGRQGTFCRSLSRRRALSHSNIMRITRRTTGIPSW